jgi:hypothetical protein
MDTGYDVFYSVIQSMDLVLPAFASDECRFLLFMLQVYHLLILVHFSQIIRSKQAPPYRSHSSVTCVCLNDILKGLSEMYCPYFVLPIQVPVLVNGWMRESYSFLDDERVVVTRPQALREIFAVKALRTGQWSPQPALSHISKEVTIDVNKMIEKGWMRSEAQFTSFKNNIWANNSQVMRQILDDALDL